MTKPLVFNYGHYEKLRDFANDLVLDNERLMADNRKLRKEVEELKAINKGYEKVIAKSQDTANKLALAGLKLQAEVNASKRSEKHGAWIKDVQRTANWYTCSRCGYKEVNKKPYCPGCGARMNGTVE